jgi:hypothetical protein
MWTASQPASQPDRHDEANIAFLNFASAPKKSVVKM